MTNIRVRSEEWDRAKLDVMRRRITRGHRRLIAGAPARTASVVGPTLAAARAGGGRCP